MSYQLTPRAKITRRDQGGVSSMDTLRSFMRYNNYQHDEVGWLAISQHTMY